MEKPLKHLPKTDSIEELAKFWDSHDLTEFGDELQEMTEPVFERDTTFTLRLQPSQAAAVRRAAESKGFGEAKLIETWVIEKIESLNFDQATHSA